MAFQYAGEKHFSSSTGSFPFILKINTFFKSKDGQVVHVNTSSRKLKSLSTIGGSSCDSSSSLWQPSFFSSFPPGRAMNDVTKRATNSRMRSTAGSCLNIISEYFR